MLFIDAAGSEPVPQIDPTLLAVLSIFGGVAVTALAGLLGAWIQGRREHKRWLREHRFAAYLQMIDVITAMHDVPALLRAYIAGAPGGSLEELSQSDQDELRKQAKGVDTKSLLVQFQEARGIFYLLGPESVSAAVGIYARHFPDVEDAERDQARAEVLRLMRKELNVRA